MIYDVVYLKPTHKLKAMETEQLQQTAASITDAILKSVGKENDPTRAIIIAVLERWEAEIRLDQVREDQDMIEKTLKSFSEGK